jgi:hypothetical protein
MSTTNDIEDSIRPDYRRIERAPVELRAVVQVKESPDDAWKEVTDVKSVSRNGAGFTLSRPCVVGRLITIVLPLETELRAYDHGKDLYPVMGIVQYCNSSTIDGETKYHVGVGFIGKKMPKSFKDDPTQSFRIVGMSKDGLWQVNEAEAQFKNRKDRRYWMSTGVTVSPVRATKGSPKKEETFTKNVSASGISMPSRLPVSIGDKVKVACPELDF